MKLWRKSLSLLTLTFLVLSNSHTSASTEINCGVDDNGDPIFSFPREGKFSNRVDLKANFERYRTEKNDLDKSYDNLNNYGVSIMGVYGIKSSSYCKEDPPKIGQPTIIGEIYTSSADDNETQESNISGIDLSLRIPLGSADWFNPNNQVSWPISSIGLSYSYSDYDFELINNTRNPVRGSNSIHSLKLDHMFSHTKDLDNSSFIKSLPVFEKFEKRQFIFTQGIIDTISSDDSDLESLAGFLDLSYTLKNHPDNTYNSNSLFRYHKAMYELGPRIYYEKNTYDSSQSENENYFSGQLVGKMGFDIGEPEGWWLVFDFSVGIENVSNNRGSEFDYEDEFLQGAISLSRIGNPDGASGWRPGGGSRRP